MINKFCGDMKHGKYKRMNKEAMRERTGTEC
jgi:hypothetical protein